MEVISVVEDLRRCALLLLDTKQRNTISEYGKKHGLVSLPISRVGITKQQYSVEEIPYLGYGPYRTRTVLAKKKYANDFMEAWQCNDQRIIGTLLGYPTCCTEFFINTWLDGCFKDTTWPMAIGTCSTQIEEKYSEVIGPREANILWRWTGVRAVPHLPCSFNCFKTALFGKALWNLKNTFNKEREWLHQILDLQVEWSCLHGIAIILTPILKVITRSEATPTKYTVIRHGNKCLQESWINNN
ncbi:MAG: hypothetical protein IH595_10505 [Bacteroidales bacterium]|nr:hypothetical protein [Bacteroidales bacterium]